MVRARLEILVGPRLYIRPDFGSGYIQPISKAEKKNHHTVLSRFFSPLLPGGLRPALILSGFPGGNGGFREPPGPGPPSNMGGGGGTKSGKRSIVTIPCPPLGGGGGLMVAYMAADKFLAASGGAGTAAITTAG